MAAVTAVGGQLAASAPARAATPARPPMAYVLDSGTASGRVTSTIHGFQLPAGAYMTPDGAKLCVADYETNSVKVIDTRTDTVSKTIPVGNMPGTIAVSRGSAIRCPCSVFSEMSTPGGVDSNDPYAVVVGVKVVPSLDGRITGVRFYKSAANTGTHTGSLWTSDGTLLATGAFTDETATGWQSLTFPNPVPVKSGATYVASYYAPNGHYSYDVGYFFNDPAGQAPITAPANSGSGGNGVFSYGGPSAFPDSSYNAANYWVDVVFDDADVPTAPPTVTSTAPGADATGVAATAAVSATFSAPVDRASMRFSVTDASGAQVPGAIGYNAGATTATFTPGTQLPAGTVFTASVQTSDAWGNAMSAPVTWTFTTGTAPPSYQCPCSLFGTGSPTGVVDSNDPNSVELGVAFTPAVNGTVTGIRFYKGASAGGVHTGTLWDAGTGTALETGTFTNEMAGGWQTMTFDKPWPVTAGNTYYASCDVVHVCA